MREPSSAEVAVFDALVAEARPVILSAFRPDSCIASTRIGLDVLDYFGIAGREIPLLVQVFNAEAVALIDQGMTLEQMAEETRRHRLSSPGGPWTMGLGADTGRPGGWAGHLVIGHAATGSLIDLSADQASRPHKGIVLEPYWLRVTDPEWWAEPTKHFMVESPDGVVMALDRRAVDATGYQTTDNWRRRSNGSTQQGLYRDLTGQIIRAIKRRLVVDGH